MLNNPVVIKPLSDVDIDESPGALPVSEQLKSALAVNRVKIISLFNSWDEDRDGVVDVHEFETGLRTVSQCIR